MLGASFLCVCLSLQMWVNQMQVQARINMEDRVLYGMAKNITAQKFKGDD